MSTPARVRDLIRVIRQHRLNYNTFRVACHQARLKCGLYADTRGSKLPKLIPEASIRRFFDVIERQGQSQHAILFRFLLYTAIRVDELVNVKVADVDCNQCSVRIEQGKGSKDRYSIFPQFFSLALKTYISAHQDNVYLFESNRKHRYTARRIRQLIDDYAEMAQIPENMHPHAFRHYALTHLTRCGLTDAQLQLISGHASKDSLQVYQHLALKDVNQPYQRAMKEMEL